MKLFKNTMMETYKLLGFNTGGYMSVQAVEKSVKECWNFLEENDPLCVIFPLWVVTNNDIIVSCGHDLEFLEGRNIKELKTVLITAREACLKSISLDMFVQFMNSNLPKNNVNTNL